MENAGEPSVGEFRASWRSPVGMLVLFLGLMGIGLALAGWRASSLGWWLGASTCGALAWSLSGQFRGRAPILRVDAQGIGSHWLKGQTVPWAEIVDVHSESVQGNPQLILRLVEGAPSLRPTARLLGDRNSTRRIPLGALARQDDIAAASMARRAFLAHGKTGGAVVSQQHEDLLMAEAQFGARLKALTPRPWALYLVVALNVGVWLAQVGMGMSPISPQPADLFHWGANSAWAVTQDGQLWRLVSAAFLHGGAVHLGLNMLGLWSAGLLLNRIYGNAQFLIIYLASALLGNALSLHFSAQQSVAVGASGAVFGVLGGLMVALLRHRRQLPAATRTNLLASQVIFITSSLAQGFSRAGVDNAAHIGGLVAGGVCTWLLVDRLDPRATAAPPWARALMAPMVTSAALALMVRFVEAPSIDHARAFRTQSGLQAGVRALQDAEAALQRDVVANREKQLSDEGMLAAMRDKHLPAYRDARDALAALSLPASAPQAVVLSEFQRLSALIVEILELEQRTHEPGADLATLEADIKTRTEQLQALSQSLKARGERNKAR